jgi:D-alanine-D-alanine ligase
MTASPRIAVLCGGSSAEAAVSRSSAGEVARALAERYGSVELVELDRHLAPRLLDLAPDVVFPVLHGPPGEDGTVQGLLEIMGLPYVGSGVRASAAAMDKGIAKCLFRRIGLPVCDELVFSRPVSIDAACDQTLSRFGDRVVVKPTSQGSGIGTTPVMNGGDLREPFARAFARDHSVLVEPFILGREVTVGVLDLHGEEPRALPPIEVTTPEGTWYDYEHRYTPGASEHIIPARLGADVLQRLESIAVAAHAVLECRDLSRADFIVTDTDDIRLLEVNTIPGMTPTSLYPDGARAIGIQFGELVDRLVRSALARAAAQQHGVRAGN